MPSHRDVGKKVKYLILNTKFSKHTQQSSMLTYIQEAKLPEIANTWESAVCLTNPVSGYQFHLGLLKIRQVVKILPLTAGHIPHAISQLVPESCQDTNKSEDKGVTVPLCEEGLDPLPSGGESMGKEGRKPEDSHGLSISPTF